MTKIGFVSTMEGAPWGGSEELWLQSALLLAQEDNTVGANVKGWGCPVRPLTTLAGAGGRITRRRERSLVERAIRKVKNSADTDWLDRFQPDFVIISQGGIFDGTEWALQCRKRRLPYVLIAQANSEQWWPDDHEAELIAQAYQGAVASYFVSEGNLKLAERQFGITLENAQVVRNPFNVSYDAHRAWPDESDGLRLACVGRLEARAKGQDILFEVLSQEKWRQRSLMVTLFGEGPNCETLRRMKERYSLDNVTFGGFCKNVVEIWEKHHALVLPSRYEGLPLAVVEAMLCGRPCIVTDVAGNAELLEDNVSGFVASAAAAGPLDKALERAWLNRAGWNQMGDNAAEKVRSLVPADPIRVFVEELKSHL